MARRPAKKHKEHTRKPLTEARKLELFGQVLAAAQAGRSQIVQEAEPEDLDVMVDDDAADVLPVESVGRIRRTIQRLARFVRGS